MERRREEEAASSAQSKEKKRKYSEQTVNEKIDATSRCCYVELSYST